LSVYFDASVIVSLFVDDSMSERVSEYVERHAPTPLVSDLAAAEFVSALGVRLRRGALSLEQARASVVVFDRWRATADEATITSRDVARADALLRRLDLVLRAPDAIHIAAAERLGGSLATLDAAMAGSARELGIELAPL
jgi:hypothetical protein